VNWFLSIDANNLPEKATAEGLRTYRALTIDEEEFEFSGGFTDLHTLSYQEILKGNGFSISESRKAIEVVYEIRNFGK
jgi:UDP-N-acetyl-2-amino-2-deoxyglucuronate dehydrogenase